MGDKKSKHKDPDKAAAKAARKAARRAAEEAAQGPDAERMALLLDAVWEHRDELQRLAVELPVLLAATGQHMQEAGLGARRASAGLAGDVRELAGHAADMLSASKDQLRSVLRALEGTGAVLRNLPFIGGELGNTVVGGLGAIAEVADHLEVAGEKVRTLGERLAEVGSDLDVMGGSLLDGALAMGAYAGVVAPEGSNKAGSKAAAPKKPAPRKASTKTAAPKKAATKKAGPGKGAPKKAGTTTAGATRKRSAAPS